VFIKRLEKITVSRNKIICVKNVKLIKSVFSNSISMHNLQKISSLKYSNGLEDMTAFTGYNFW